MKYRRVRLTRKLARMLDGIDVSAVKVGDIMELPAAGAEMLVAERWAEYVDDDLAETGVPDDRPTAAS